jgi:hypothetical protein
MDNARAGDAGSGALPAGTAKNTQTKKADLIWQSSPRHVLIQVEQLAAGCDDTAF